MNWLDSDDRPWGRWEEYLNEGGYRVKRIVVDPGQRLSLQKHLHRAEFWVVVAGGGVFTLDGTDRDVRAGDQLHIPVGGIHRVRNDGVEPLVVIETQLGRCDEDDIVRIEDDYGRA
jgi:mannose-6-phosphate isomerase-like protein (cupin superfamily)